MKKSRSNKGNIKGEFERRPYTRETFPLGVGTFIKIVLFCLDINYIIFEKNLRWSREELIVLGKNSEADKTKFFRSKIRLNLSKKTIKLWQN